MMKAETGEYNFAMYHLYYIAFVANIRTLTVTAVGVFIFNKIFGFPHDTRSKPAIDIP